MNPLNIQTSMLIAKEAHNNQFRKFTNVPYLTHPLAVAGIVLSVVDDEAMVSAALLHDVVEDSDISLQHIASKVGYKIAWMVEGLTDTTVKTDGNRKIRKAIYRKQLAEADSMIQTIKLADIIDNIKNIHFLDPGFAKVYLAEKKLLLKVLIKGNKILFDITQNIINRYYE